MRHLQAESGQGPQPTLGAQVTKLTPSLLARARNEEL